MYYKEAKAIIERLYENNDSYGFNCDEVSALYKAIEALEYRIPKMMEQETTFTCPNCHSTNIYGGKNGFSDYCGDCGQAIIIDVR